MEKLLCPSMMCADYGRLAEEIKALDEAGVDIFHCDIMDSTFVPNITMGLMDLKTIRDSTFVPNITMGLMDLKTIRKYTKKPVDVHLMIENPGEKVDWFLDAGADIVYITPRVSAMWSRRWRTSRAAAPQPALPSTRTPAWPPWKRC